MGQLEDAEWTLRHGEEPEDIANGVLLNFSKKYKIKTIATNNTYYVNPEAIENGQSEALIIKPPTDSSSGSQVFNSVYCIDNHCGNDVLKKNNKVIYKPNNTGFSNQGGVPSSLRTLNIQKNEVNKAAVSLKKDFGRSVTNNSRYRGLNREPITTKSFNQIIPGNSLCKNVQIINTQDSRRQPSGGTGNGLVCGD